jgi:hypothetical protein
MPIEARCGGCGAMFNARNELAGRSGKCRRCGDRMFIPIPEPEPAVPSFFAQLDAGDPALSRVRPDVPVAAQGSKRPRRGWPIVVGAIVIIAGVAATPLVLELIRPNPYTLGPKALGRGDLDEADRCYRLALEQAIREDNHLFIAISHRGLSDVAFARNQWAKCEAEIRTAIEEYSCPLNTKQEFNDIYLAESFLRLGAVCIFQKKFEEGVRLVEEGDALHIRTKKGFDEPSHSLGQAMFFRKTAELSGDRAYLENAALRIKRCEEAVVAGRFGSLVGTPAHAMVLREKAELVKASGYGNGAEFEAEADRIEAEFEHKEASNKARHQMPR